MANQENSARYDFKYEVMVVDDELQERDWIINYLVKEGYSVSECSNGEDVYALLESRYENSLPFPDVALVDLHIPDEKTHQDPAKVGLEIIRGIREKCDSFRMPQIPCIAYTMKIDPPTLADLFQAGAAGFIPKNNPPDENILLSRMSAHIKDNVLGVNRSAILRRAAG